MARINNRSNRESDSVKSILLGILLGVIVQLMVSAIISYMITKEIMPIDAVKIVVKITMFAAALLGAYVSSKSSGTNKLFTCSLFAFCFAGLQIVFGMLFFDGLSTDVIWNVAAIALGTAVCFFLELLPKKKNPYRKIGHG